MDRVYFHLNLIFSYWMKFFGLFIPAWRYLVQSVFSFVAASFLFGLQKALGAAGWSFLSGFSS